MSQVPILEVGCTGEDYVVRLIGRGTMRESPAFFSLANHTLEQASGAALTVDLSRCEYLDSTFLGSLVSLHKRYSQADPPRFVIAAPEPVRQRLLAPTRLDRVLACTDEPPPCQSRWAPIAVTMLEPRDFGRHVLQCHRVLADLEGPCAGAFRRVAEQMARELGEFPVSRSPS